jgi:hypothetical protein
MRAKYINKTARRRTIRPDGDSYRALRKYRGGRRGRSALVNFLFSILTLGMLLVVYYLFIQGT